MQIFKEFSVEAAHRLPHVPEGYKRAQLHAYSLETLIYLEGPVGDHLKPALLEPHAVQIDKPLTGSFVNHG